MTKQEITAIVNMAFEAVNESCVGPVWVNREYKQVDTLAMSTFQTIVAQLVPKMTENVIRAEDKKEPWQE